MPIVPSLRVNAQVLPATRLETLTFIAYPSRNPNGLRRPDAILADATVRVGSDFLLRARVERRAPGARAQMTLAETARDLARGGQIVPLKLSPDLHRQVYHEIGRLWLLSQARAHQRGAGRN